MSGNKKTFFKNINSKMRSEENTELIPVEDGLLKTRDEEKAEAFNAF